MNAEQIHRETSARWPEWAKGAQISAIMALIAGGSLEAERMASMMSRVMLGADEQEFIVALAVYGVTAAASSLAIVDIDDGADDTAYKRRLEQAVDMFRLTANSARKAYLAERREGRVR